MSYYARTMEISNKMRFHGEEMKDVKIVEKILRSLTLKYDYVVCSIEDSKDIDALSLDKLQGSLLVHEQKINRNNFRGASFEGFYLYFFESLRKG